MKKIYLLIITIVLLFTSTLMKSQCAFGNFPPTYTFNPGWTNGIWLAKKYSLPATATLTGLGLNALVNSGTPYRMAIYTDASNAPGNFITATSQGSMSLGQNVLSVATVTVLPAGNYWITALFNSSSAPVGAISSTLAGLYLLGSISTPPASMSSWTNTAFYDLDYWAVINTPSITVAGPSTLCLGSTINLTVSGASTYTWNTNVNTTTISLTPTGNTGYTVSATGANGCKATVTNSIAVFTLPTVSIAGANTVCAGAAISLTASGASSYQWNNGIGTTTLVNIPSSNIAYSVTGTDANGCTGTAVHAVALVSPTLTITGNTMVCAGAVANLSVSGASTYLWDNCATTTTSSITPSVSAIYTVTGFDANNCMNTQTISITVNPMPVLTYTLTNPSLCEGETGIILVSGATTFSWNNGSTGATFSVSPAATTVYTVTGADLNNCISEASITQSVNACTGLQAVKANLTAQAFPNPSKGLFELRMTSGSMNMDYVVVNVSGEIIKRGKITSETTQLNLSNCANGFYYVIVSQEPALRLKLIKN